MTPPRDSGARPGTRIGPNAGQQGASSRATAARPGRYCGSRAGKRLAAIGAVAGAAVLLLDGLFAAAPPPVEVPLTTKETGVGFGNLKENDNALDLIVDLKPPQGKSIKWPSNKHDEGEIIWGLQYNGDDHRWKGAGVIANKDHHVRFSGELEGGQGGTGTPDFHVSVVDLDIDADTSDAHCGAHCAPLLTVEEDKKEEEDLGGLWLEKGMIERLDPNNHTFPDDIPPSQLDSLPYKILHVKCEPRWYKAVPVIGFVSIQMPYGTHLYDITTGHHVITAISVASNTVLDRDYAIVTNNQFTCGEIRAHFFWQSLPQMGTDAEDIVKVRSPWVIEADFLDNPPAGSTYASGIDVDSVELKLNGSAVFADVSYITNGVHVRYVARTVDLVPGFNHIQLFGNDRAGNEVDLTTSIWSFTQN